MEIGERPLNGYSDKISVRPGETIRFHVSCDGPQAYDAQVVRLICADDNPAGAPFEAEPVDAAINGTFAGKPQMIHAGSHVMVPSSDLFDAAGGFTLQALVMPTTPSKGRQGLLGTWSETEHCGASLIVADDGSAGLIVGDGKASTLVSTGASMVPRAWYSLAVSYDPAGNTVTIRQTPLDGGRSVEITKTLLLDPAGRTGPLIMAAWHRAHPDGRGVHAGCFNGRLEAPRIVTRCLDAADVSRVQSDPLAGSVRDDVAAAWDFSRGIDGEQVIDITGNGHHGETLHLPQRGVRGHAWSGREMCWRHAPHEYGAVHFHDDDVYDAAWPECHAWTVPDDTPSALYALQVSAGEAEDIIPFAVVPPRGTRQSDLCFLLPTATYMAYANSGRHFRNDAVEMKQFRATTMTRSDCFLQAHSEYGLSTYDTHSDGSGVSISSRLRPALNMRPKVRVWGLAADTHITSWLEKTGFGFDVITDEELHNEGLRVLEGYRTIITGTHPEYHTVEMLDALEGWIDRGGRLIYTGANGFYWRIAYHPELPGVIECRKTEGGTRSWVSEVGESFMSFTGEYGGLWRRSGRTPQELTGIGFTAQGFDRSSYYRRLSDSHDPRAAFIFEGIDDEIIGDQGLVGGGAAGLELDRADFALGTPLHTLILARSENHSDGMLVVLEELTSNQPVMNDQHPKVHADITFFECDGGGAVFSTGSIAFAGALPVNGYDNPVARMMHNVVTRFLDPADFEGFDALRPASKPVA
ncbi:MAG: N,N-dimethylformamidase [Rhodospirillaceae bacterium]|nr:N,N-dimethylformamidase [Rhodospirillaceae bacterium]